MSSSTKDDAFVQFNGNNYPVWRTDVRAALVAKEVWHSCVDSNVISARVVDLEGSEAQYQAAVEEVMRTFKPRDSRPSMPPKVNRNDHTMYQDREFKVTVFDSTSEAVPLKIKEFRSDMCKAYGILMRALKPQFKIAVQNFETAKEVWDYMEATYNTKTTISKVLCCSELFRTQMKSGGSLKNHLAWFDQKSADVKACGFTLGVGNCAFIISPPRVHALSRCSGIDAYAHTVHHSRCEDCCVTR